MRILTLCRHVLIRKADMQPKQWPRLAPTAAVFVMLVAGGGCHQKPSPVATSADVAAAQQAAQHEVEQAQVEARKGLKSATKIMGAGSKDVARAKVTGGFDIAMAHADGDHKIAIEECMTLEPPAQQSCKDRADLDNRSAVANAKANRVSQQR